MTNILDYVAWRGDLPFSLDGPNEVDALIFSALSYIPFRGRVLENPTAPISLKEAAADFFESLLRRMRYFRRVESPSEPLRLHEFHEIAFSFECHPPAFGCFFTEGRSTINLP